LPNGNLIVPVIKNADQLNLVGMAKAVNDLGGRAKAGDRRRNLYCYECRDVW
jgi:2-oxoglutarate dehydrogenase E2 component (dihydrolipoamide succinyltransferase)